MSRPWFNGYFPCNSALIQKSRLMPAFLLSSTGCYSASKSKWHDGEPKIVQIARQGEANKVNFGLEMELANQTKQVKEYGDYRQR